MTTQRVYHPETCEPFDVPPSKAADLVLNKGWSHTPWTRAPEAPVVEAVPGRRARPEPTPYAPRGRGRRRPAEVIAPAVEDASESWPS